MHHINDSGMNEPLDEPKQETFLIKYRILLSHIVGLRVEFLKLWVYS